MRIAALTFVSLLFPVSTAFAGTTSVYTDATKCKVHDTHWDHFFRECKGPNGRMVTLFYLEGIARIIVDKDEDSPSAEAAINVGGNGKVFGDKIEWRLRDGKPCAVITRVSTDKGSRLVVTSLDKPARPLGRERTNEEAHRTADRACDNAGHGSAGVVSAPSIPGLSGPAAGAIREQIKREELQEPDQVHVSITAGMAAKARNEAAKRDAAQRSGLFVQVKDVNFPRWQFQTTDDNLLRQWNEIITQAFERSGKSETVAA